MLHSCTDTSVLLLLLLQGYGSPHTRIPGHARLAGQVDVSRKQQLLPPPTLHKARCQEAKDKGFGSGHGLAQTTLMDPRKKQAVKRCMTHPLLTL